MKIEEISAGNYIKRKSYKDYPNGVICKVTATSKEQKDFVATDMQGWQNLWNNLDNFEPVYIKDVIDKLRFEKVTDGGFDYYQIFSDDYLDVRMEEFTDGLYEIRAVNCELSFPTEVILTSQFHTLQNFLTMLNADIKIEL
jgi:hypothetical protein